MIRILRQCQESGSQSLESQLRGHQHARITNRDAVLREIVCYYRTPYREILSHLDHGARIGEWVRWTRLHPNIRARHDVAQRRLTRNPSEETHGSFHLARSCQLWSI